MNLSDLVPDAEALGVARAAFLALAKDGAPFREVRAVLMRGGMRSATARRFIERMEMDAKMKLAGERPAARTVGANRRLATTIRNASKLRSAKRAQGNAGRYGAPAAGGKRYANALGTKAQVVFCQSCRAPVVDTRGARQAHMLRVGCATI